MTHDPKSLSRYWLVIGVLALAVAGLFALLLVVARTPVLSSLPGFGGFFHEALVVHVNLSVLVWFLAVLCLMWSLHAARPRPVFPWLEESALISFAMGAVLIALSPLDGKAQVMMSNYIPVIHSPVFFLGLMLLLCGTALMLVKLFWAAGPLPTPLPCTGEGSQRKALAGEGISFGILTSGLITLIALCAFAWSYMRMPAAPEGTQYYELLFWGGGHVLQLAYTQMMMVAWLMAAGALGLKLPSQKISYAIFGVGLAAGLLTPLGYGQDTASMWHRTFFTQQMIWLGGLAPLILAWWMIPVLCSAKRKEPQALHTALGMSLLLFLAGGALGHMIEGQNVVVPAHYHGSIVGVTLAFMGLAWLLLPRFGWRDVTAWKSAYWQPVIYGGGQLLHIAGLAWSGGYGVLRKTPGALDGAAYGAKGAMGLMGLGGLLSILGGLMFVLITARAMWPRK